MDVWQRILDRFVPLLDEDASRLDRLDGVGTDLTVGSEARSTTVPSLGRLSS